MRKVTDENLNRQLSCLKNRTLFLYDISIFQDFMCIPQREKKSSDQKLLGKKTSFPPKLRYFHQELFFNSFQPCQEMSITEESLFFLSVLSPRLARHATDANLHLNGNDQSQRNSSFTFQYQILTYILFDKCYLEYGCHVSTCSLPLGTRVRLVQGQPLHGTTNAIHIKWGVVGSGKQMWCFSC